MYLHLGADVVVTAGEVVAILDPRVVRNSDANRRLVERAVATGELSDEVLRGCRALVVTSRGIFASAVSAQSLARRMAGALGPPESAARHMGLPVEPGAPMRR